MSDHNPQKMSPQNVGFIIAVIGAIIAAIGVCLMSGCSLKIVGEREYFWLRHDVSDLQNDMSTLKREVRDLSRGYRVVPIRVTITNLTENVQQEER